MLEAKIAQNSQTICTKVTYYIIYSICSKNINNLLEWYKVCAFKDTYYNWQTICSKDTYYAICSICSKDTNWLLDRYMIQFANDLLKWYTLFAGKTQSICSEDTYYRICSICLKNTYYLLERYRIQFANDLLERYVLCYLFDLLGKYKLFARKIHTICSTDTEAQNRLVWMSKTVVYPR